MKKGFTLIELLVVISIISLLSSIVLSSLQSARDSANLSAVVSQARQMANLFEIERLRNNSYAGLNASWVGAGTANNLTCEDAYTSSTSANKDKAIDICNEIINKTEQSNGNELRLYGTADKYSVTIWYKNDYLVCYGSNGGNYSGLRGIDGAVNYTQPGCITDVQGS